MKPTEIPDIRIKIIEDFGANCEEAIALLNAAIDKTEYLQTPRIIRSIIFLSRGQIDNLLKNVEIAVFDPRDIMSWAEYDKPDFDVEKRIRNFNNSFDESEKNMNDWLGK